MTEPNDGAIFASGCQQSDPDTASNENDTQVIAPCESFETDPGDMEEIRTESLSGDEGDQTSSSDPPGMHSVDLKPLVATVVTMEEEDIGTPSKEIGKTEVVTPATEETAEVPEEDEQSEDDEDGHFQSEAAEITQEPEEVKPESFLSRHTDPFAIREGRTLIWKNVNMSLRGSKGVPEKPVLRDCWGECPKGETTAIMGASGAAGRLKSSNYLNIKADVRLNNYQVDPTDIHVRQHIAFVAQDDTLPVTATPRECIRFSAKLRLPGNTTELQLDQLTLRMLEELGLTSCADSLVGGALIKGISGGERKRTSVGVELVTKPGIVLRKVARSGASVLFTIHQPASEIFDSFDHLILMNKGRVMYQGPVKEVPVWFRKRGHSVPRNYNPADWVIDVAQGYYVETLEKAGYFPKDGRDIGEAFEPEYGKDALGRTIRRSFIGSFEDPSPGVVTQTCMLFQRELQAISRDWTVPFFRIFLVAFVSVFIGLIFRDVGGATDRRNRFDVQSIFGGQSILLVFGMLVSVQLALLTFPDERPVFLREYSTKHYSVFSYFLSHFVTELLITAVQTAVMTVVIYYLVAFKGGIMSYFLSSFALALTSSAQAILGATLAGDNTKLAQQLLPILFAPQMMFAGFFLAPNLIPDWLSWAQYICSITYSTRIVVVAEFEDCAEDHFACVDMLQSTKAEPNEMWWYWLAIGVIFLVCRLLALIVLQRSALQFY